MAIRGVIFDYGMVLSQPADPVAHARMVNASGLSREIFDREYWRHRHSYDLGLTGAEFWQRVATGARATFTPEQVRTLIADDVLMWTRLNEDMMTWVAALQEAGFRTAILSNMTHEIMVAMLKQFDWLSRFSHLTWSCELGIAKPDADIYLHTCRAMGTAPGETLFLDDKPENITGAERAGLHALLFTSVEQLKRDLVAQGYDKDLPLPEAALTGSR